MHHILRECMAQSFVTSLSGGDMIMSQMLTTAQRREIEGELLAERARLERMVSNVGETSSDSRMLEAQSRHDAVKAALERLENGAYGVCLHCEQPIPYGRLAVIPEATTCLGCKAA
jgi:RNA polymerase-binding transcription factor DksA